ncbi:hypothetical protein LG3211_4076 [Lysobacter gummosus]|jgi:hypothetical protein|nr:hypothetical protein LG3211_4076 [Lysobacter gummosus]
MRAGIRDWGFGIRNGEFGQRPADSLVAPVSLSKSRKFAMPQSLFVFSNPQSLIPNHGRQA